jgi:predicted O-methyltransferase YrrM
LALLRRAAANLARPPLAAEPEQVYDVSADAASIDLSALEVIRWAPVWMTRAERLLLYTLTFTLRPMRYLEIGTLQGGSALVVCAAMDALDTPGRIVCLDPEPKIAPDHWQRIEHRATLVRGYSPPALARAREAAGGLFDFVLIDGDHSAAGVLRDADGVLPFVTDGAYLLFHDSLAEEVGRGVHEFLARNPHHLVDFGILTREIMLEARPGRPPLRWGGLRLIQVRRSRGRPAGDARSAGSG